MGHVNEMVAQVGGSGTLSAPAHERTKLLQMLQVAFWDSVTTPL